MPWTMVVERGDRGGQFLSLRPWRCSATVLNKARQDGMDAGGDSGARYLYPWGLRNGPRRGGSVSGSRDAHDVCYEQSAEKEELTGVAHRSVCEWRVR